MSDYRNSRYPYHLARLVAQRLIERDVSAPPQKVLLRLFETMYFASLKTDEARPCRCTVNYIDPSLEGDNRSTGEHGNSWSVIPFGQPLRLDVRALLKLADAADPTVSSLAVFSDDDDGLFVWGLVDQELRYGDYVALDTAGDPQRPGLFQATITGVGGVSAYKDFVLLGSLEQSNLVDEYHDVLWAGPVHRRLKDNLQATLLENDSIDVGSEGMAHIAQVKDELLVRWQNAICRILLNIQQYGHGGGLLIVPQYRAPSVDVKYEQTYDRMPRSIFRLAQHQIWKRQTTVAIASHCQSASDLLPCAVHFDAVQYQEQLDRLKSELIGCVRYIASLSRVDGFVLLDKSLVVHGFGVEARADSDITDICVAGDSTASQRLTRQVSIHQFGTRHRAMMRYCHKHEGALGFVISQDGDIRAMMRYRGRLVLWENINLQLAYRIENRGSLVTDIASQAMAGLFQSWTHFVANVRSA